MKDEEDDTIDYQTQDALKKGVGGKCCETHDPVCLNYDHNRRSK